MQYHKLLRRQLKRLGLEENLPTAEEWAAFKKTISKTYTENDQERYLLERSMEISSEEMLEINDRLTTAQDTAGLGYWFYDKSIELITLSPSLYRIFGLNPEKGPPTFDEFMKIVHEENRSHLEKLIENAFLHGHRYEYEFRMKYGGGEYRWYYVIGHPASDQRPVTSLTGIVMDITKRKNAEEEISALHRKLIDSARYAGMADIASATLHNVGNVLNSAHVSIELIKERSSLSSTKEIEDVLALLQKNLHRLPEYIQKDPQGKFVPEYLIALLDTIKSNYDVLGQEILNINKHLSHIKDIISTQNGMSRASGLSEKLFLPDLIDSAFDMASTSFDEYSIRIVKEYQEMAFVFLDKVKVLQILVNLIRNAKEALMEDLENTDKLITCSLAEENSGKKIIITIKDNGVGIVPTDLNKIFSLGFSTKPNGHGFGLHMSAIAAKEMGGNIYVESKGRGKGAAFTLTLPKVETQTFQ
jgi:PAS domain S-box-containing protein